MFKKVFSFFWKRKLLLIILIVILSGFGYLVYSKTKKNDAVTTYLLTTAERGTIIKTVSGTGQVSVLKEVELKSEVSGNLTYVNMKSGQKVKKGDIMARIGSSDAQKSVRDARLSLESAQLSLEKLRTVDDLSLLQSENALSQAKESKQKAIDNLEKAYEDTYNGISNAFLDFPSLITELEDFLYSNEIGKSEISVGVSQNNTSALLNTTHSSDRDSLTIFQKSSESDYATARLKYNSNFNNYKKSTRYSDKNTIEDLLGETIETARSISQAAKSESNYLDVWVDYRTLRDWEIFSKVSEYQSEITSCIGSVNNHLSNLLSIQRSIQDYKESIINADRTIEEREASLKNLKAGADELDIKTQELNIMQKQDSLSDALDNLAKYTIKAPFDGSVALVNSLVNDSITSATALATIITDQKIAEITLNEVDIANIKTGQRATLTFDAIEDLSITGGVVEVDTIGTISQGIVNYTVKIAFDTDDERIKPGMSVGASIIIDLKQDVVIIPSSAVKTKNGIIYVEIPDEDVNIFDSEIKLSKSPRQQTVVTGLSEDSSVEIISGLNDGDIIIKKTITSSSNSKTNSLNNNSPTQRPQSILSGNAGGSPMMR
ncbi:MAG: HlyD family efflux transporter periplasmic adaptor subunit [Patescibacteria group bacterium]|nr:HlyD family efflux transporter periplasmic adaptor subunit [Patescibacteria group bacterium]